MERLTQLRATRLTPALSARLKRYARSNEVSESLILRLARIEFLARPRNFNLLITNADASEEAQRDAVSAGDGQPKYRDTEN